MIRRARMLLGTAVVPVGLIALWWFASAGSDSVYFPPLEQIMSAFKDLWLFERWESDVLPSLERMAIGYALAAAAGVTGGLVIGLVPWARRAAAPLVEFLRSIPPAALIPFAILLLGVDAEMKIFVIATGTLWPILLNAVDGVRSVDQTLLETARAYGIGRAERLRRVILPAAGPQIFAGLRTSLSLALILMVISEMVASTNGIGYFVIQAQRAFEIPEMWSGIILLGLLGFILNLGFTAIERRALRWYWGAQAMEE
jgi:ABC-type nitrate/sulfonate/bicarbonate transport system permease component